MCIVQIWTWQIVFVSVYIYVWYVFQIYYINIAYLLYRLCLNHNNHSDSIKCILEGLYRQFLSVCVFVCIGTLLLHSNIPYECISHQASERERKRKRKKARTHSQSIDGDNCEEESLSFKFINVYAVVVVALFVVSSPDNHQI